MLQKETPVHIIVLFREQVIRATSYTAEPTIATRDGAIEEGRERQGKEWKGRERKGKEGEGRRMERRRKVAGKLKG